MYQQFSVSYQASQGKALNRAHKTHLGMASKLGKSRAFFQIYSVNI